MNVILPPKPLARPVISVIMGVKNGEKTLSKTIESLLSQDFWNWELIAIDDGSEDETFNILSNFQQQDSKRITIVRQSNQGLTKSLNLAIGLAKGSYIARLDADDLCLPFRFSRQLSAIKNNQLDFVVDGDILKTDVSSVISLVDDVPNVLRAGLGDVSWCAQ